MKTLDGTQIELIDAILAERDVGGLTPAIFEKDIHVTDALLALLSEKVIALHNLCLLATGLHAGPIPASEVRKSISIEKAPRNLRHHWPFGVCKNRLRGIRATA